MGSHVISYPMFEKPGEIEDDINPQISASQRLIRHVAS
jgi:hypothetical protein